MRHALAHLILAALALSSTAWGQAPPIDDAVEAWSLVRNWVDAGRVPAGTDAVGPAVEGVAVQLTWQGKLIGADTAHRAEGSDHPLTQAARGALAKALTDHRFTSLIDLEGRGQNTDLRRSVLSNLAVEIELSGPLQPLTGPTEFLHRDLHPAQDGLAVRRGTNWSVQFPSRLRVIGQAATRQTLNGTLLLHSVNEVEADTLRRTGEVTVYRMPTIVLRQMHTGETPSLYLRGREDAAAEVASAADAIALSNQLADGLHRFQQVLPDTDGWLGGTWSPHRNEWDRRLADSSDAALCAYALSQWTVRRNRSTATADVAWRVLRQIEDSAHLDPRTAVLSLLAAQQLEQVDLVSAETRDAAFAAVNSDDEQIRAMAVLASVRSGNVSIADSACTHWLTPETDTLTAAMPWALDATGEADSDALRVHADLLREVLLIKQLDGSNPWGPEVSGAIHPGPDADAMGMASLREGHILSTLILHADPSERVWLRGRALRLATHLQRRTIGVETARQWASPDRARNRVRLAPWDERVSISAQAFALLTALNLEAVLNEETSE